MPRSGRFFFAMALYYDLPVFKEVYQLVLKIFEYTKDFPKDDRAISKSRVRECSK
jgi:hypothetical protein